MSQTLTIDFDFDPGKEFVCRLFNSAGTAFAEVPSDRVTEGAPGAYSLVAQVTDEAAADAVQARLYSTDSDPASDVRVALGPDNFSSGGAPVSGVADFVAKFGADGVTESRIRDATGGHLDLAAPLKRVTIGDVNNAGHNITLVVSDQGRQIQAIFNGGSCDFIGANVRFTMSDGGGTLQFSTTGGNNQGIDFDCGQGSVMFGDLEGQANGTKIVLDDSEQSIELVAAMFKLTGVPSADPGVAGALYMLAGVLMVSAG